MKNEILLAKNELYESLIKYNDVVGVSVRKNQEHWYIVILLSRVSNKVINQLPAIYKGTPVMHEITGKITSR